MAWLHTQIATQPAPFPTIFMPSPACLEILSAYPRLEWSSNVFNSYLEQNPFSLSKKKLTAHSEEKKAKEFGLKVASWVEPVHSQPP
jgi:hypothetical protein